MSEDMEAMFMQRSTEAQRAAIARVQVQAAAAAPPPSSSSPRQTAAPEQLRGEVKGPMPEEGAWRQTSKIPGGGGFLPKADPRAGHLIVVCGDGLAASTGRVGDPVPPLVKRACAEAVAALEGRCVVVCCGGTALSHAMVQHLIFSTPGGVDACGPGRKIELVLKEPSAEWGNLWLSALQCKNLTMRQSSLIKFERLTIVTADALADVTRRVYEHVLSDWQEAPAAGCPGLTLTARTVPASEEVVARAALIEADAEWFERNAAEYAQHVSMPKPKQTTPKQQRALAVAAEAEEGAAAGAGAGAGAGGGGGSELKRDRDEGGDDGEPPAKK